MIEERSESLGFLAELFEVKYNTLARAAKAGRLTARQSGKVWLSSRAAVKEYLAQTTLKPRKK